MSETFWEKTTEGLRLLSLRGRLVGRVGGFDIYEDVSLEGTPIAFEPSDFLPLAPTITVNQVSRTQSDVTITPPTNPFPRSPLQRYILFLDYENQGYTTVDTLQLGDPGANFSGPFTRSITTPTNTPIEAVLKFKAAFSNADGQGAPSNTVQVQWAAAPVLQQPSQFTSLAAASITSNSVSLSWVGGTSDTSITKCGIFVNGVLTVDNIGPNIRNYVWSGLNPSTVYANVTVRRYNGWAGGSPAGWSNASNPITFTTSAANAPAGPLFLGHVPGKLILGWSTSHTEGAGAGTAETQLNTQTPFNSAKGAPSGPNYGSLLGVRRLYSKVSSDITYADGQNRMLWISAKGDEFGVSLGVAGWGQVASGAADSGIVSYFNSLVARNKLTVFTFHHEPVGDANNPVTDGTTYCNAMKRIKQVVNANYPGHRILFCPNYEENRLRNLKVNNISIDWSKWLPEAMLPGIGDPTFNFDFISWDMYQYGANTSTNVRAGVQFSHRWWRIDELFTGAFTPAGTVAMPYMDFTPGVDLVYGLGECAHRAGAFFNFEANNGGTASNMTGAKYTRDMMDYVRSNIDKFWVISWFNSIGADIVYNDERLYPGNLTWGGDVPNHDFTQQTGDTEYAINAYRELLNSGLTTKLAAGGLPVGYVP